MASQRNSGIDGFLDLWIFSGFNRRQCVRDWSGILLERSGKRYSGKPDGDSRNALIQFIIHNA